jgi:putative aminopeptidase FrvX
MDRTAVAGGRTRHDDLADLVKELCSLPGPAGAEEAVSKWLVDRWRPHVQTLSVLPTGSLVARVGGSGRCVAIVAHMDEIAFYVTCLRDDGLLEADPLRPWPPGPRRKGHVPIGQPAEVMTYDGGIVEGTFATTTGHVATDAGDGDDRWWIDVGCSSAEQLRQAGIHIGAPVVSGAPVRRTGTRLVGKAMDDRALLAAMTALIEQPEFSPSNDLWLVATVQEEIGGVGASALGPSFAPEVALSLDVAPSGLLPGHADDRFSLSLGGGPVLVHKDISIVYDRGVGRELRAAAASSGRPLQDGAFPAYFSDGRELVRYGSRPALLALPCRYTHSSFETIELEDLAALVDLLSAWA